MVGSWWCGGLVAAVGEFVLWVLELGGLAAVLDAVGLLGGGHLDCFIEVGDFETFEEGEDAAFAAEVVVDCEMLLVGESSCHWRK